MRLLVTGGCGFIGSAFVRLALGARRRGREPRQAHLRRATRPTSPRSPTSPGYSFVHADIADAVAVRGGDRGGRRRRQPGRREPRRPQHPRPGRLHPHRRRGHRRAARRRPRGRRAGASCRSRTDEVYGSIAAGAFRETDPISPSSPYSASKAGGDLQVLAWHRTFGLDAVITRGSNTFGPRQYPEKLIPLFVTNALDGERAAGLRRRHAGARLDPRRRPLRGHLGRAGARRAPGRSTTSAAATRCPTWRSPGRILDLTGRDESLIRHVADRPGHDRRYALDTGRLRALGWAPRRPFADALAGDGSTGTASSAAGGSRSRAASTCATTSASTAAR